MTAPLASNTRFNFTDIYAQAYFGPSAYQLIAETTIAFSTNAQPPTFSLFSSRFVPNDYDTVAYVPSNDSVTTAGPFQMINDYAHLQVLYVYVHAFNADIDVHAVSTHSDY